MSQAESAAFRHEVHIEQRYWSDEQLAATRAHHGFGPDDDVTDEHLAAAGHTTPAGGTRVVHVAHPADLTKPSERTETHPDGRVERTLHHADGRIEEVTGA